MESLFDKFKYYFFLVVTNITVEPILFFNSFSDALDDVSISQMKLIKSCKHDFNFTDEICDDLLNDNYTMENDMVQDEVHESGIITFYIIHQFQSSRLHSSMSTTQLSKTSVLCCLPFILVPGVTFLGEKGFCMHHI